MSRRRYRGPASTGTIVIPPVEQPASTMPTSLSGWTFVSGEDFNTPMAKGAFVGTDQERLTTTCAAYSAYGNSIGVCPAAWGQSDGTTRYADYNNPATLSVVDSKLRCEPFWNGTRWQSGWFTFLGNVGQANPQAFGPGTRIETRMRMAVTNDPGKDVGAVGFIWPIDGSVTPVDSPNFLGEMDWPEGYFSQSPPGGFGHPPRGSSGGSGQNVIMASSGSFDDFNNYAIEWDTDYTVKVYMNSALVWSSVGASPAWTTPPMTAPHKWVWQSGLHNWRVPANVATISNAIMEMDWIVMFKR